MGAASHVSVFRLVPSTLLLLSLVPNPSAAFFHQCGSMEEVSARDCGCEHEQPRVLAPSETESRIAASQCCQVRQSQGRQVTLRDEAADRSSEAHGLVTGTACTPIPLADAKASVGPRGERDPPKRVVPLFKLHRAFLN